MSRIYSTPQVCATVGISHREIDYWRRIGVVQPSVTKAAGSGSKQRWSEEDVRCFRAVAALRRAGLELDAARRVVPMVRDAGDHRWAYIADGVAGTCDATELASVATQVSSFIAIDLEVAQRARPASTVAPTTLGAEMRERFGKEEAVT